MIKQTAVQDLIKELKQFKKFPMVDQPTIQAAIDFAELRLEMEKEQIVKAALALSPYRFASEAEDYYNKTYTQ